MNLNFRGTKLSRFVDFRVYIFADAHPIIEYYIEYIDYIYLVNRCSLREARSRNDAVFISFCATNVSLVV